MKKKFLALLISGSIAACIIIFIPPSSLFVVLPFFIASGVFLTLLLSFRLRRAQSLIIAGGIITLGVFKYFLLLDIVNTVLICALVIILTIATHSGLTKSTHGGI